MITAVCWVPKGAFKHNPETAEPPSKEEIEKMMSGTLNPSGDEGDEAEEEEEDMDVDSYGKTDEVEKALDAVRSLGKATSGSSTGGFDVEDALRKLNMENYDEEDDGIALFSSGLGDAYYPSNDMDPYLLDKDDEDDEEIEDITIKPTDGVIICAHHEDDVSQLEVLIYEDHNDGAPNMFVHHEVLLAAYPLCLAWSDCNLKSGDRGNFVAVGTMDPAIEIWDLDVVDEAQPYKVLGGVSKKKRKTQKGSVKYKKGSHKDAVLDLAWNKDVRNVLASASADKSVKVWDVVAGKCELTLKHHSDKVQSIAWNPHSPELLLSGSCDHSVNMMDMRNAKLMHKWSVAADVESVVWNPHSEHAFVVSLENGTIQCFDTRAASDSAPIFTLHAHDKAVCSVAYCPTAPNLLATGSMDKTVKLWDLSDNQPSCVASKKLKAGAIFSLSFYEDSPSLLAVGGSKGNLQVWDTLTDPAVSNKFGNAMACGKKPANSED